MNDTKTTTDINQIKRWVGERNGVPAVVVGTDILRIDFADQETGLYRIDWKEFEEIFKHKGLAFLYQNRTSQGNTSRFFKFIEKDRVNSA